MRYFETFILQKMNQPPLELVLVNKTAPLEGDIFRIQVFPEPSSLTPAIIKLSSEIKSNAQSQ